MEVESSLLHSEGDALSRLSELSLVIGRRICMFWMLDDDVVECIRGNVANSRSTSQSCDPPADDDLFQDYPYRSKKRKLHTLTAGQEQVENTDGGISLYLP